MKLPVDMEIAELKQALPSRIRKRAYGKGEVCYLDLRSKQWGRLGDIVLHDPSASNWPDGGGTTNHLATARSWINDPSDKIPGFVLHRLRGDNVALVVADAVEPFIEAMHHDPDLEPLTEPILQE